MNIDRLIEDMERIRGIKPLKRFMVVDDDVTDCEFMKLVLSQRGAMVTTFRDVEKAIGHLGAERCSGTCYTRIFVDLSFPVGKQGVDFLEHVRLCCPNTPVAIVSGFETPELIEKAHEAGYAFIYKSAAGEEFRHELEKYL